MAAVSCPCIFCWPRKEIENEGGQPIFEVNVQVTLKGWAPQKIKCNPKIKCRGLILFSVYFFSLKGASAPPFYLGTSILIGANLGSSWRNKLGQVGRAAWAEAGPNPRQILRTECDTLKTCIFAALFPMFGLWSGFVRGYVPYIGPVVGPTWAPVHTHVLSPTCAQTCPRCAMLDPSWAQVGANWPEVGASQAEVGAKLLQVAPWASTFPVYPILWMRAVLVPQLLE